MFNHLFLNRKKIPVPVPVRTLAEAVQWVETYLLSDDKAITKIELDGAVIEDLGRPYALTEDSRLFVQIDSPIDLSVQTSDALRNLITLIAKDLKPLAVTAWQSRPQDKPEFVDDLIEDLSLALDMLNHIAILLEGRCQSRNICNTSGDLHRILTRLELARSNSDWKAFAKIMLRELEDLLNSLAQELISLQNHIFELQAERRARTG